MDLEPRTVVAPVDPQHLQTAALVAARGMRDNPLHVAAIGDDPQRRIDLMRRAFETVLRFDGRSVLGAWQDDRLVGVASYTAVDHCRPTARQRLALAPVVASALSVIVGGSRPPSGSGDLFSSGHVETSAGPSSDGS